MQWNFHFEENDINVKFEITYFDCESIRTNNWKEVCLFNIWKTGFYTLYETYFIPQLMTSLDPDPKFWLHYKLLPQWSLNK